MSESLMMVTALWPQAPDDKEKIELLSVTNEAFVMAGEADSILLVFEKEMMAAFRFVPTI